MFNKRNKFYITTPIYYANAYPHIGHAYTSVAADVLARWNRQQGKEVFLLTGTDEHGLKIQKKAQELNKNPKEFVDEIAGKFKSLGQKLNISYGNFIRTTDEKHIKAVQKVLQFFYDQGAIYKGTYEGLYCVGCEQFKNESDLVNGKCPEHNIKPEKIKEESYLLKMEKIQPILIKKIKNSQFEINPPKRRHEILAFLEKNKLRDISISRKNVSWGIPLPFDKKYTAYVWIDAFLNYLTGIGWEGTLPLENKNIFSKKESQNRLDFWSPDIQLIGKDILRVHATIWPAILTYLNVEWPKQIFVHGHILSGGRKMSKTIGNVIGIDEMLNKFGTEATRYLLMSAGTFGEDIDVTMERMIEKYNADLANGLGNLTSRIIKLSEGIKLPENELLKLKDENLVSSLWVKMFEEVKLDQALKYIWRIISADDKFIDKNEPWKLIKTDKKEFEEVMKKLLLDLANIANLLVPFMPETSEKIKKSLKERKIEPLFQRIK